MVTFTTELLELGNNVGIEVPEDIVTIEGYSYPSTNAVMGGKYLLPLAKEHREKIGVDGGETRDRRIRKIVDSLG